MNKVLSFECPTSENACMGSRSSLSCMMPSATLLCWHATHSSLIPVQKTNWESQTSIESCGLPNWQYVVQAKKKWEKKKTNQTLPRHLLLKKKLKSDFHRSILSKICHHYPHLGPTLQKMKCSIDQKPRTSEKNYISFICIVTSDKIWQWKPQGPMGSVEFPMVYLVWLTLVRFCYEYSCYGRNALVLSFF